MDGDEARGSGDVTIHPNVHEVRFWQNLVHLRRMVAHIRERDAVISALSRDASLPEKTRDDALSFLKKEREENLSAFHDFLANFVTTSLRGLHRTDISLQFSFELGGSYRVEESVLHIDGKPLSLPQGEGEKLISLLVPVLSSEDPCGALLSFYKACEEAHDRGARFGLESCRLELFREVYPGKSFHATLRLPASTFFGEKNGER
ncbi:MAG: hypothetical protein QFX32_03510 [Methanolinea sp.]|nr:hypothetical protein [Methanolinea sp.]